MSTDEPLIFDRYGHRLRLEVGAPLVDDPASVYRCLECGRVEVDAKGFEGAECFAFDPGLDPEKTRFDAAVIRLTREVRRHQLSDFERLVALRQAYADLAREKDLDLSTADERTDSERFGRGLRRDEG